MYGKRCGWAKGHGYRPVLDKILNSKNENELMGLKEYILDIDEPIALLAMPLSINTLGHLLEDKASFLLTKVHSVLSAPKDIRAPVRILHSSLR